MSEEFDRDLDFLMPQYFEFPEENDQTNQTLSKYQTLPNVVRVYIDNPIPTIQTGVLFARLEPCRIAQAHQRVMNQSWTRAVPRAVSFSRTSSWQIPHNGT